MRSAIAACLVVLLAVSATFAGQPMTTVVGPISVPLGYDQTNLRLVFWPSAPFACDDTNPANPRWWVGASRSAPQTITVTDAFTFSYPIAPNTGYNNSPDLTTYTMQLQTPQGVTLYTVTGQIPKSATPVTFASIVVNNPTTPVATGPQGAALGPTTTTSTLTVPSVSATVVVPVLNGLPFPNLSYVLVSDGTHAFTGQVTSGGQTNSLTVTCAAILLGSAGNTMANGALLDFSGPPGAAGATGANGTNGLGYTTTSAGFTIPAINSTVAVSVVSGSGLVNNSGVMIDDGAGGHAMLGLITAGGGSTTLTVKNLGLAAGSVGNTMASGGITFAAAIPYTAMGGVNTAFVGGATLGSFVTANGTGTPVFDTSPNITTPTFVTSAGFSSGGTFSGDTYQGATTNGTTAVKPNGTGIIRVQCGAGGYRNLLIENASSTSATITADALDLVDTSGNIQTVRTVSRTLSFSGTGPDGLDTGVVAIDAKYAVFVYWDVTAAAARALASTSLTPTLPNGSTFSKRVGWLWTKHSGATLIDSVQAGNQLDFRNQVFTVTASDGGLIASGLTGTTGTYALQSLSARVPSTSRHANLYALISAIPSNVQTYVTFCGANNSAGSSVFGFNATTAGAGQFFNVIASALTSSQGVYWALNFASGAPTLGIGVTGYTDNI